jgi:hypothetical protein
MWYWLTAAAFIGAAAGALAPAVLRAIVRSDWLFWLCVRADLRAIARAKRHTGRHGQKRQGPRRNA